MPQTSLPIHRFKPAREPQNPWHALLVLGVIVVSALLFPYKRRFSLSWIEVVVLIAATIYVLNRKKPVGITIDMQKKALVYRYKNWRNIEKQQTINLIKALGNYKYAYQSKYRSAWQLKLYEGWRYRNRLVLVEETSGFNKTQLDKMAEMIEQCQA